MTGFLRQTHVSVSEMTNKPNFSPKIPLKEHMPRVRGLGSFVSRAREARKSLWPTEKNVYCAYAV